MFTIFRIVKKILNYLNSNESISNIALSLTFAIIYTFIPFNLIFHTFIIFLLIILNGNFLIFIFLTPLFLFIIEPLYPIFHNIGNLILNNKSFYPLFEKISNMPILNFLNWNNTVSLGGYIIVVVLCIPIYKIAFKTIEIYRKKILPKIKASKLGAILKVPSWIGKI